MPQLRWRRSALAFVILSMLGTAAGCVGSSGPEPRKYPDRYHHDP